VKIVDLKQIESLSRENEALRKSIKNLQGDLEKAQSRQSEDEERLRIAYLSTMNTLVKAIEFKDPFTKGHYELVSKYAVAIGKRLHLGPEELDRLRLGGLLMDIGKIAIDTALWTKKESLSEKEREILHSHIRIGAEITDPIIYPWNLSEVIFQHHERYDGSGYPKGLIGEKIIIEAQILGICDSFLAMMANRAFREAYSRSFTISTIKEESGRKFDPKVVEAFVEVVESGESEMMEDFAMFYANGSNTTK